MPKVENYAFRGYNGKFNAVINNKLVEYEGKFGHKIVKTFKSKKFAENYIIKKGYTLD